MKKELAGSIEDEWIEKTIEIMSGHSIKDSDKSDEDNKTTSKKVAVAPWSLTEFQVICEKIKAIYETPLSEQEKNQLNKRKKKKTEEDIKTEKIKKALKNSDFKKTLEKTVDIALSGRMTTSGIMTSVDGALAVAHAITTHSADNEIDWFTAVDDLKQSADSEDKGSAHLDTTEFSAGVFYRYASLNLKQLQKNMGVEDSTKPLEIASHVAHLLATVTPSAKQQSFAAHNMADFALVSFSHQPLSLANAFETPVKDSHKEGLLKPSVRAVLKHQKEVESAYGLKEDPKAFYSVRHCYEHSKSKDKLSEHTAGLKKVQTLKELKKWIKGNGKLI